MNEKKRFLQTEFISLLKTLEPNAKPNWGLMNAHQMVEHMMYSFKLANGELKVEKLLSPEENIPKLQEWVLSSKSMKENINNPLVPETPTTPIMQNYLESISKLEEEMHKMFKVYEQNPKLQILNPFFGLMNEELNINLLYKHALHHLKQFGIVEKYIES